MVLRQLQLSENTLRGNRRLKRSDQPGSMNRHSGNSSSDKKRLKRSDQPGSMNRLIGNNSGEQMRLRKSVMQDLRQCVTALQKHEHGPGHKSTTMPTG